MSSANRFEFQGLAELRLALRNLPEELTGEAANIIQGEANQAVAQIKRNYPFVAGDLIEGVNSEFTRDRFHAVARVHSDAFYAKTYEYGSQVPRRSRFGNRGLMPAAPPGRAFVPVLEKARRSMYQKFRTLMERHGLVVTGDAR